MKDPWLWEEADILNLISNAVQESLTLDYKRCDSLQKTDGKKKEISKDVSAFANSAGGVIIYGVEEDKHLPTGIDVGFDPSSITKEWIEQVINSNIEQRIDGIRIKEVALSGPKAGRAIYVVSIPQSRRAPHMASDYRYYKRFNFESVYMEDYEVRDVARRLETPDLLVQLRLHKLSSISPDPVKHDKFTQLDVQVVVRNNSPAVAEFAFFNHSMDIRLSPSPTAADNVIEANGDNIGIVCRTVAWRGNNLLPLWETVHFEIASFAVSIPVHGGPYYLFWDAQAPNMRRKAGMLVIHVGLGVVSTSDVEFDWKYKNDVVWKV